MVCELCRKKEATNHLNKNGTLDICSDCLIELQESLGFYINSQEVVVEEFKKRTNK